MTQSMNRSIIRFVCKAHDIDLDYETDGDGNPRGPLYRIRYDEASHYDVSLAKEQGILSDNGEVLRPGHWHVFDFSNFYCRRDNSDTGVEEPCSQTWIPIVVRVVND